MRFRVIKTIYFLIILLIVVRLGYWQVFRADDLSAMAEDQRTTSREIVPQRGTILFSDKTVLAATQPTFLVYAEPQLINNDPKLGVSGVELYKEEFASKLAPIFYEDDLAKHPPEPPKEVATESAQVNLPSQPSPDELKKKQLEETQQNIINNLSKKLYWVSLGRKVDVVTKEKIEKLNLLGIGFEQSYSRFYPEGSSSAHLMGFVGSDNYGEETGYFGLEGFYNGELKGRKGLYEEERDALGLPILIGKFVSKDPQKGKTLVLNIDRAVQNIVEQKLKDGMDKYQAKAGSVVVMDPNTGNVLAMASLPSYDPSRVVDYPSENFKNSIVADAYEPGSTFKTLVAAAAINEHLITPETICGICSGPVDIGGYTIRTWDNKYRPNSNMTDVIVHSDNIGMVFISRKLGLDKLYSYITKFGFGQVTGVDLQDEESPDLRPLKDWKEIDQATASFGQGISATALQVVRAVAAIANGGKLMEPHMVAEVSEGQKSFKFSPKVIGQPITPDTAQVVKEMMVKAVDLGESQYYKKTGGVANFKIAGKTGTAQIPVAGHYDATKTIASFVGFAPADNPKFVILVRYQEPKSSIFGADTAAPTFFGIAKELFSYYGIAPDEVR